MKTRQLGPGGPQVSAIGLGCMSFGGIFGPTSVAESHACLDAAWEAGIDFLDTADIYGMGVAETVMGQWLATRRHPVHIATKAGIVTGPARRFDNSDRYLRQQLEGSLKRLGVDHVALFYIHRREPERPVEEVVQTLQTLIAEGKIGGYGLSEVSPGTLRRAHAVHPCRAVQNEYSLWTRQPELGLLQTCAELGTAFVPFSPLARGALGRGNLNPAGFAPGDFRATIPRFHDPDWGLNLARIDALRARAADRGVPLPALAMAWVLDQGPHLIPIPGTRSADHLRDWAGAADLVLTDEDRRAIGRCMPVGWAHGDRYGLDQAMTVERYC